MITPYMEMCDMISCYAIYNGAEPKDSKIGTDDALANVR